MGESRGGSFTVFFGRLRSGDTSSFLGLDDLSSIFFFSFFGGDVWSSKMECRGDSKGGTTVLLDSFVGVTLLLPVA